MSIKALPAAQKAPQNLLHRQDLQAAGLLAGLAISSSRTAIAHAISYPFTSYFRVPHGLACSFTLPYLLTNNISKLDLTSIEIDILNKVN